MPCIYSLFICYLSKKKQHVAKSCVMLTLQKKKKRMEFPSQSASSAALDEFDVELVKRSTKYSEVRGPETPLTKRRVSQQLGIITMETTDQWIVSRSSLPNMCYKLAVLVNSQTTWELNHRHLGELGNIHPIVQQLNLKNLFQDIPEHAPANTGKWGTVKHSLRSPEKTLESSL